MRNEKEIEPPWVKYPGYSPGDGFWRQSGELWIQNIWEPYWKSLNPTEQNEYLKKWAVPNKWRDYYFNPDFHAWLEKIDGE